MLLRSRPAGAGEGPQRRAACSSSKVLLAGGPGLTSYPACAQIEGRGNGIKTNVVNCVDIAKALERPPDCESNLSA